MDSQITCGLKLPNQGPVFDKIPVELLEEIFSYALPTSLRIDEGANVEAFTHGLSRVCTHWRAVLDSIPRLWSNLEIDVSDDWHDEDFLPLINLYLSKTCEYPLDLSFTMLGSMHDSYDTVDELKDLLGPETCLAVLHMIQQMQRCSRLDLIMEPHAFALAPDLVLEGLSFPHLESIEHSIYAPQHRACTLFFKSVQARAPKLTSVLPYDTECMMPLPYDQLLRLQFRELYNGEHIRLLPGSLAPCTNLQTLKIDILYHEPDTNWSSPAPKVLLPHLRELDVSRQVTPLLEILDAPSLKKVQLWGRAEVASALAKLIRRSKCHLTRLSIELDSRCPPSVLTEIIQASPSLRSLDFSHAFDIRYPSLQILEVLEKLVVDRTQTRPLAPNLLSLTIGETDSEITMEAASIIFKLLESRSRPSLDANGSIGMSPLEIGDFGLSCSDPDRKVEIEKVFALREANLKDAGVNLFYKIEDGDDRDI